MIFTRPKTKVLSVFVGSSCIVIGLTLTLIKIANIHKVHLTYLYGLYLSFCNVKLLRTCPCLMIYAMAGQRGYQTVADPGLFRRDASTLKVVMPTYYFDQFLPGNCMKMKKVTKRGVRVRGAPLCTRQCQRYRRPYLCFPKRDR